MTDYHSKYLKYKSKYINLRNQYGGASNYNLDLKRTDNKTHQEQQQDCILLNSSGLFSDNKNKYNTHLHNILGKLMNFENDEFNFEFINTISAIPFVSEHFDIIQTVEEPKFKFKNENLNYKIEKVIMEPKMTTEGGGGGDYIFSLKRNTEKYPRLEIDGYPENLILKLFKGKEYFNYSPLLIVENDNEKRVAYDERYQPLNDEQFNKISFDKDYKTPYKEKNRKSDVYLNIPLDNFQNEIVQNLIINKILKDKDDKDGTEYQKNIIQFYNYLNLNIVSTGMMSSKTNYNCILMEKIDDTLFQKMDSTFVDKEYIFNQNFQLNFIKYIDVISYLKNTENRFTHTDLKTQNVFLRGDIKEDGDILIADLDKSSITYNGIRFYNGKLTSKTLDFAKFNQYLNQIQIEDDFLVINELKSRQIAEGIEVEQILMRYNYFPFIPYLDFFLLYGEMLYLLGDDKRERFRTSEIYEKLNSYNKTEIPLNRLITVSRGTSIDHTNFGDIVYKLLILNATKIPIKCSFNVVPLEEKEIQLITDRSRTKLALSKPLKVTRVKQATFGIVSSSVEYETEQKVDILYTGNEQIAIGTDIYKVNRFTYLGLTLVYRYLKEFMLVPPTVAPPTVVPSTVSE